MQNKISQDARIASLTFASVYPHYVQKVEKKGRTALGKFFIYFDLRP